MSCFHPHHISYFINSDDATQVICQLTTSSLQYINQRMRIKFHTKHSKNTPTYFHLFRSSSGSFVPCLYCFIYIYLFLCFVCLYQFKDYCHRVTTQMQYVIIIIIIIIIMQPKTGICRIFPTSNIQCSINLTVAPCNFVESLQFINQRMHI